MLTCLTLLSASVGTALAWPGRYAHNSNFFARRQDVSPPPPKEPVAATWYASWHAKDFPLSNVSWSKYSIVTYSFALTMPDVNAVNITDPEVFKDFVSTAHANNCSAAISVGGWTGSQYFSSAVATAENRTAFAKTLTNLVKDNNLDGLDFDWEYPNKDGIGCNTKSPNDTANFLAFLQELNRNLPDTKFSAATSIAPFSAADGTPAPDVSEFAKVLDYIAIMNYDIWGAWSPTVGPNAPLNDTCANDKQGSAVSAVKAWTAAGIPASQLVLGVPAYGHSFSVPSSNASTPYPAFNSSAKPVGDGWDEVPAAGSVDQCGALQTASGNWNFWGLIAGGYLNEDGTPNTAGGAVYRFDECSQTPYVYNKTTEVMVSYDDATSFAAKGKFIRSLGLRGFAMWEAGGDYKDILVDSIRTAAGYPGLNEPSPGGVPTSGYGPTSTAASSSTEPTEPIEPTGSSATAEPTVTPNPEECEDDEE